MRVLSALVLTHCFGCVIPKEPDDNFMRQRPTSHRRIMADNSKIHITSSRGRPALDPADADNREERYGFETMENQAIGIASFMDIPATGHKLSRDRHTDAVEIPKLEPMHLILGRSVKPVEIRKNSNQVNAWELASWQQRQRRSKPQQSALNKLELPLRSHIRHILAEQHVGPPNRIIATAQKRNNSKPRDGNGEGGHTTAVTEEIEIETGDWDEWTEWSQCSVSCSCGRQVRWRHCAGKGCMNGLKKAQIKTCHLRDCNSKNFLSWLGIKA